MADFKQDKKDEVINTMNNELAGIKSNIDVTNKSINAMKDSMDTHLKTVTDTMDTRLTTFTDTMNTGLETFTNAMNTFTDKMDSGLKTITTVSKLFCLLAVVSVLFCLLAVVIISLSYVYQRHCPAQDDTRKYHPSSESTLTLTSIFRDWATREDSKVYVATEGKPAIAYIDAGDEGYFFTEESVTCQLMSELTGAATDCSVQYIVTEKQYEVSYQATSRGRHQLHIKVEGEHIKGSPFIVNVIRKIGTPIKIIDMMGAPQGIAFSQENEMVVAEYREHRVAIISPSLESDSIKRFGSKGTRDGQFNHPCGVAVDDDGNILMTDQKNGRIQKFNSRGKYITKVNGNHDTHSLELGQPVGIGIHPHTKMIYVTDIKHHRIQILDPDLNYSSSFGSKGKGNGLFDQPKDVAFDSAGDVYVADNENHRIQVFSKTGQYLRKFGRKGTQGDLYYPSSISIDSEDVIYVTELHKSQVSMFTLHGDFLHSFGSKGNGKGEFFNPRGINVDKNGIIYVSDHDNDRIQVF